ASWRLATAQGGVWEAFPANPTVGDTIWLVRALVVPAGWQVRAAKFEPTEDVEPLTEPSVRRVAGAWVVRYALAAWKPGAHKLGLPPIWRLGPDGRADSAAGGGVRFGVAGVGADPLSVSLPLPPPARHCRVSGHGRAGASPCSDPRASRSLGAAGSGRVRVGARDGHLGARADGAPPGQGRGGVSFARPLLLLALGFLPLWWWMRAKRLGRLAGTRMSDVRPAAGVTERLWVARLPVTLRSACLGAWIVAAAGPRVGAARSESRSEGISIVLAIDMS